MAEVKPMMIEVEALKPHSTAGKNYAVGDKYDVPEDAVENLSIQGMAARTDRVAAAKKQESAAKAAAPKAAKAPRKVGARKAGKHKS